MTEQAMMPPERRQERFQEELVNAARFGSVTPLAEFQAQLVVPAQRVNHVLHLLLCLVSCFLWAPVWIVLSIRARPEQRRVLFVDEAGRLWVDGALTEPETYSAA